MTSEQQEGGTAMWLVFFLGLGLLGFGLTLAIAWLLLLFASAWIAAGIATFCTLTAVGGIAGRVRPGSLTAARALTVGMLGAWVGSYLALPLAGVTDEDGSTLLWFFLGAVLGLTGGGMLSAFTATRE